ncbi:multifunctional CCA tRNA nucleotidyl transferase/2'3'-cyclic phosphodiesterase/2'nucleotidase/phosphatase [Methylobacillus sp. MM3]|jgi:tRNA nucleotidyltransferase (CCA-adding enzyme)|uniref:multifunctional CCA addition/repair protein n=1 Tax=Methylobacillus sp. MM3 TaxID=1848039 RepID=UPI0007E1C549|nr:multifunctional CCA addition/repair protein [Methylobacillus sp. MM3]OAJ70363.1 multifunctional CCA tRNA nucleotidyl transferase/2'3'-cyclic phosphodiesterase/2'nucleotidase/phosphatase [Methylobacillus sp. MM3]
MQVYCVGGAVRDELLGRAVKDHDYVVVGATPEQMTALGYRPVGKDFPVFLHPKTQEEYALARTERKTAKGYKGFQVYAAPEVTLEQDLARRDLTINAIARDSEGALIDPYRGVDDLRARILRHVGPAFVEDPVRILRLARFAARFADFTVAAETQALMREMVENGEVDALIPERVWQELAKGLMEARPSRMFEVLRQCGALKKILPEVDRLFGVPQPPLYHPEVDTGVHVMLVVDYAAAQNFDLPVRFAALMHDLGKGTTPAEMLPRHIGHEQRGVGLVKDVCKRLRVPNDCRDVAVITANFHGKAYRALEMRPDTVVQLLHDTDALRQPQRFEAFLQACESDVRGRPGFETRAFPEADYLRRALAAAQAIDAGAIAGQFDQAEKIRDAVFRARVDAVAQMPANS